MCQSVCCGSCLEIAVRFAGSQSKSTKNWLGAQYSCHGHASKATTALGFPLRRMVVIVTKWEPTRNYFLPTWSVVHCECFIYMRMWLYVICIQWQAVHDFAEWNCPCLGSFFLDFGKQFATDSNSWLSLNIAIILLYDNENQLQSISDYFLKMGSLPGSCVCCCHWPHRTPWAKHPDM